MSRDTIKKILDTGDIINIDVTVILNGWYGDTSRMFIVGGKASIKANKLIQITYECMIEAIKKIKPGLTLGDIGYIIEKNAKPPTWLRNLAIGGIIYVISFGLLFIYVRLFL